MYRIVSTHVTFTSKRTDGSWMIPFKQSTRSFHRWIGTSMRAMADTADAAAFRTLASLSFRQPIT